MFNPLPLKNQFEKSFCHKNGNTSIFKTLSVIWILKKITTKENRGHYVLCTDGFPFSIESPWDHSYQTASLTIHGLFGYNCFWPTSPTSIQLKTCQSSQVPEPQSLSRNGIVKPKLPTYSQETYTYVSTTSCRSHCVLWDPAQQEIWKHFTNYTQESLMHASYKNSLTSWKRNSRWQLKSTYGSQYIQSWISTITTKIIPLPWDRITHLSVVHSNTKIISS